MAAPAPASENRHEHTVALTRFFDAPRERVFEAWTDARQIAHWFAPQGFTIHSVAADATPGGEFRLCMRAPDGDEYWVRGEYREVTAPGRLVIFCTADDETGVMRLEELIDVSFEEDGRGTRLSLKATASGRGKKAAGMLSGMDRGWAETIDRLALRVAR